MLISGTVIVHPFHPLRCQSLSLSLSHLTAPQVLPNFKPSIFSTKSFCKTMFDFGDEIIIESYRIPWVIWIQLLVMVLLVVLLFYFGNLNIDPSNAAASSSNAAASSSTAVLSNDQLLAESPAASSSRNSKVGAGPVTEIGTSTGRGISTKDDVEEREVSSTEGAAHGILFGHSDHPCHFLGLAKQAFLKCLGLDSTPGGSSNRYHRKEH